MASSSASTIALTGACTYSVSVPLPTGRGLDPTVTLQYDSTRGNSPFGLGFGLGVPTVSRSTTFGVPRYRDDDLFEFDGQLVAVSTGTQTIDKSTYTVTRFRPRLESSYSRIEYFTAPGDSFWRVTTTSNGMMLFGKTPGARIAEGDRIFEWLLEYECDARGNAIAYRYKREDIAGVRLTAAEQTRTQGINAYLARIDYGNSTPYDFTQWWTAPSGPWCFSVVVDYGEYAIDPPGDDPIAPVRSWSARQDPFSDYKSGFERRTHRLCRNILVFHTFAEIQAKPTLVSAVALGYDENPVVSRLVRTQTTGYRYASSKPSGSRYRSVSRPPIVLGYQPFAPEHARTAQLRTLDDLPVPALGESGAYAFTDLRGDGLPGVLYADRTSIRYWEPVLDANGDLRYRESAPDFPLERNVTAASYRLLDLDASSRHALTRTSVPAGFYATDASGSWQPFRAFRNAPLDLSDAGSEFADIVGSGRPDHAFFSSAALAVEPSLGYEGFEAARNVVIAPDIPPQSNGSATELVIFGSVCGTGLQQRVRVSNGCVECWPMLGHAKFAGRVVIPAPRMPGGFNAASVMLADLDGSGLADLVYIYPDRADVFLNQSGNGFASEPISLPFAATCDSTAQVLFTDLYGSGTDALVYTRYLPELCHYATDVNPGGKPYLLTSVDDSTGSRSFVRYTTASRERLQDERDGQPWATTVPIPIQIVAEVEHLDAISRTMQSSSFRYHHGYYEARERRFEGFGFVESFDVERTAVRRALMGIALPSAEYSAPLHTKTWYHIGSWEDQPAIVDRYKSEWFAGDTQARAYQAPLFDLVDQTSVTVLRQANTALSGTLLRTEQYGLDVSDLSSFPYAIGVTRYAVRQRGSVDVRNYAPFDLYELESLHYDYERAPADPRVTHSFTLEIGAYGEVCSAAAVAYARRPNDDAIPEQLVSHGTLALSAFFPVQDSPASYLAAIASEARTCELTLPKPGSDGYYTLDQIAALVADPPAPFSHARMQYQLDSVTGALAPQLLLERVSSLAFDDAQLSAAFGDLLETPATPAFLRDEGGYVYEPVSGTWWNPGGFATFNGPDAFFTPASTSDGLTSGVGQRSGITITYGYDPYYLMLTTTTETPSISDALPTTNSATAIDYQALVPRRMVDSNGFTSEVLLDPLGMPIARSFYGTQLVNGVPATAGFAPLPDDDSQWSVAPDRATFLADPSSYMNGVAQVFYYDIDAWRREGIPVSVATATATTYAAEDAPMLDLTYVDGFARVVQRCQAAAAPTAPKPWLISGRVLYTTKGEPYRTFEPSYAATADFVSDMGAAVGVAETLRYDPLGRVASCSIPKGEFTEAFFETNVYGAWKHVASDRDDTVLDSPYYQYYITGKHDLPPWESDALQKAAALAQTPSSTMFDSLGRAVEDQRLLSAKGAPLTARRGYDIRGNVLWDADPRLDAAGLRNVETAYAYDGQALRSVDVDAGTRHSIHDIVGALIYSRDPRGYVSTIAYDSRQRPTTTTVTDTAGSAIVTSRTIYGDSLDGTGTTPIPVKGNNAIGEAVVVYDGSGRSESRNRTILGMPQASTQQLPTTYDAVPDWSATTASSWQQLYDQLDARLDATVYTTSVTYDALSRVIASTDIDGNTRTTAYDRAGRVAQFAASVADGASSELVSNLVYNPRGQLTGAGYGGTGAQPIVASTWAYDPDTFLLANETATRRSDGAVLRSKNYFHDPVGNITHVEDVSPGARVRYAKNAQVTPDDDYVYDALYRLIVATGRAHPGLTQASQRDPGYGPFFPPAHVNDRAAQENYTYTYRYDNGNNLSAIRYASPSSGWTQRLQIDTRSNRAIALGTVAPYPVFPSFRFDAAGNALEIDGVGELVWDCENLLDHVTIVGRETPASSDLEYYRYTLTGTRCRKVRQRLVSGQMEIEEALYFSNVEIFRRSRAGAVVEERRRVRLATHGCFFAENLRWTVGTPPAGVPAQQTRYQIGDESQSSSLELDASGALISFEAYAPYGATVDASGSSLSEVDLKLYRFCGKERDRSTGLYYFGARYYVPWLARWLSPDPAGRVDGANLYEYLRSNPVAEVDAFGENGFGKATRPSMRQRQAEKAHPYSRPKGAAGAPTLAAATKAATAPPAKMDFTFTLPSLPYAPSEPIAARTRFANVRPTDPIPKKSFEIKRETWEPFINYPPNAKKEAPAGTVGARWYKRWVGKRPAIPGNVRETLVLDEAVHNQFTKIVKNLGTGSDLAELGINQDHKLAQSSIGMLLASIMDVAVANEGFTDSQKTGLKAFFVALHNDKTKGEAEFATLEGVLGEKRQNLITAAYNKVYKSTAGSAAANLRFGDAVTNQIIGNVWDPTIINGDMTPRSKAIKGAVEALPALDLASSSLVTSVLKPATYKGTSTIVSSSNWKETRALHAAIAKAGLTHAAAPKSKAVTSALRS